MRLIALTAIVAGSLGGCAGTTETAQLGPRRHFRFEYGLAIRDLPAAAEKVRLWIPLPANGEAQTVSEVRIQAPVTYTEGQERTYGNRLAYFEFERPFPERIPVTVSFEVTRREVEARGQPTGVDRERLLAGDRMAPLNAEVRARSARSVDGLDRPADKVRAIYDRVLADVRYDKSGEGWGRGDLVYVCRKGKGNCSDFHTLFIAMARAQGIPAVFEVGFMLPEDRSEGEIGGYHCWAWYESEAGVWRPVDVSEADKHPEKREYYFGTLCQNRVAVSWGRDLLLEPSQSGDPVNFLVYPHVEVDGKPGIASVERKFRFRDLDSS